ncbi:hypothetical protein ABVK25_003267 [Lepraria finkii]|uniref:Uncharacterized protein n=1 Tax=Lepraria finkii TaxID=1340010 RepID=A0ABR4BEJ3_9LECA
MARLAAAEAQNEVLRQQGLRELREREEEEERPGQGRVRERRRAMALLVEVIGGGRMWGIWEKEEEGA